MPDAAAISLYHEHSGRTFNYFDVVADRTKHNEALKITDKASAITVRGVEIVGGDEDALDCNDGVQAIDVHFDRWLAWGKYVATIKGGALNVRLSGCIVKHGREVDIDIGNHSDQSSERTKGVRLNLRTQDGSPVTYRVLHGHDPIIENPEQAYRRVGPKQLRGLFGHLYPLLKKLAALFGKKI